MSIPWDNMSVTLPNLRGLLAVLAKAGVSEYQDCKVVIRFGRGVGVQPDAATPKPRETKKKSLDILRELGVTEEQVAEVLGHVGG